MLKHRSPRTLLVVYALLGAFLISSPTAARAATACVWRMTNAPAPFYLVGTIHALSGRDYPLPKAYMQALHDSRQFYFEVDVDPRSGFDKLFDRAASYPKGDDIRRHIHPQTWDFLAKKFRISNYLGRAFHIGENYLDGIQQLRPWAIADYIWGIRGYSDISSKYGVDNYFYYHARRTGKACGALETPEEHVDVLRGMADIDAELLLLDALVRGDKRRDDFNATRDGWKHGNIGPILAEEKRERDMNTGAQIRLLDYRNLRWIPKIEGAIRTGVPTSIVVGTGHFCGPNNVLNLLQKKATRSNSFNSPAKHAQTVFPRSGSAIAFAIPGGCAYCFCQVMIKTVFDLAQPALCCCLARPVRAGKIARCRPLRSTNCARRGAPAHGTEPATDCAPVADRQHQRRPDGDRQEASGARSEKHGHHG